MHHVKYDYQRQKCITPFFRLLITFFNGEEEGKKYNHVKRKSAKLGILKLGSVFLFVAILTDRGGERV